MSEPRPLPDYSETNAMRWYCLDCRFQTTTEMEMKTHHKAHHETDSPLNQIDYCMGGVYQTLRRRRDEWIAEQAEAFAHEMHEGFGADDFIAEAEIRSA